MLSFSQLCYNISYVSHENNYQLSLSMSDQSPPFFPLYEAASLCLFQTPTEGVIYLEMKENIFNWKLGHSRGSI